MATRERPSRQDYAWIAFGWLLVPVTAIVLDAVGLIELDGVLVLATAVMSAMAGGAARAYRQQLRRERDPR
ncbi:hypothetical protein ASG49_16080 [Marmoricola sp. Leaf446]|uniref:Uncharacterized protein n=1 Tax=Nocardioides aurantiacus TaxID=86796 RepID=A0A3N2CVB4_9ACTN|nr:MULTISPECIES: hypothetical protein [Nocardioidaceae]KQT89300.1 hypothetical protein ASG49_16080 [Marmoricola sp. Leaf446]ROR91485.1 hypothetical protein EDD33_2354 [Nocardioides aurantiacus]